MRRLVLITAAVLTVAVGVVAGYVLGSNESDGRSSQASGVAGKHQRVDPAGRHLRAALPKGHTSVAAAPGGPTSVTLAVTGRRRQLIQGWGASIVTDSALDPQASPRGLSAKQLRRLDRLVFRTAGINLLRIFGPGFATYGAGGEGRLRARDGRWQLMRRAKRYGVRFLFTASDAPASMKDGRRLAEGAEGRFARYIAGNLSFAQRLGVPFDLAALGNEIDNGASIIPLEIGSEQAARVYDALAREIERRRLPTRLAIADNLNWGGALRYAGGALRSPRVRRLARVVASHAYGGDESRGPLGSLARGRRLRLWMTEWTPGCPDGSCPDRRDIGYALRWAGQIVRDLTDPAVNAWFLFRPVDNTSHGADSGIIVRDGGRRRPFYATKRFSVFRQFTSAAPSGARRLDTRGYAPVLAFRNGRRLSVVVTNFESERKTATLLLGSRRGRLLSRRTSQGESFRRLRTRAYDGARATVPLPPQSVTTFTLVYPR